MDYFTRPIWRASLFGFSKISAFTVNVLLFLFLLLWLKTWFNFTTVFQLFLVGIYSECFIIFVLVVMVKNLV